MSNKIYYLRFFTADGDYVTEGEFETVGAAWDRAADIGSRWIFYPIAVVTTAQRIKEAPEQFKFLERLSINNFSGWLCANAQEVADMLGA